MAIDYDKLLALKIPDAEHTYGDKDTMLYALGVGLGHDPTDRAQLDFVYEKNLKALPSFACLLGYPGFWVRDLDTGIDWVRIVNGEQGFTLNAPVQAARHRGRQDAHRRGDRQGRGQGRGGLHRAQDHRQGERRAGRDRDADHVLPRRRRLRRAAARKPAVAQGARARARSGLRSRHAAGDGADLSALGRPQSAARRSRCGQGRGLSAPDPARARHLRRGRPCAAEERVRLRSDAASPR